jgi:hypothetical protein
MPAYGISLLLAWGLVVNRCVVNRRDVNRLRLILVLFLLAAAVCVSTIPRPDLPETAFNEADAPVNLAPPFLPRIQAVSPSVTPVAVLPVLPNHNQGFVVRGVVVQEPVTPKQRHPRSFQDLLCTFLI